MVIFSPTFITKLLTTRVSIGHLYHTATVFYAKKILVGKINPCFSFHSKIVIDFLF